jgi:hypothetical protein
VKRARLLAIFQQAFNQDYRESSDKPRANAFCRVAPIVRLSDLAIPEAWVFFWVSVFKVLTCSADHARCFDTFLAVD